MHTGPSRPVCLGLSIFVAENGLGQPYTWHTRRASTIKSFTSILVLHRIMIMNDHHLLAPSTPQDPPEPDPPALQEPCEPLAPPDPPDPPAPQAHPEPPEA